MVLLIAELTWMKGKKYAIYFGKSSSKVLCSLTVAFFPFKLGEKASSAKEIPSSSLHVELLLLTQSKQSNNPT